jgi:predicted XRE-type DNA-binding protein
MSLERKRKAARNKGLTLKSETVESSSGNVFADLGLPDAEELQLRARLATSIRELVEQNGWTKTETARRARINQSQMSNLLRGRFPNLSVERLSDILNQLDR